MEFKALTKVCFTGIAISFLTSCQTSKVTKVESPTPTFSVFAGKTDPLMCNVQGEMEGCRADWTVTAGILTHREVCNSPNRKFIKPMLNAMARTLTETCTLKVKYARLTTKDDAQSEKRLAKLMSQSKLWNRYSQNSKTKASDPKVKAFPEKFIQKVVEVKGIFSEATEALNAHGYNFAVAKVEVTKLNNIDQSRHFQSLKQIKAPSALVVPENIRIVWVNKNFVEGRPARLNVPQNTKETQGLPTQLPPKTN